MKRRITNIPIKMKGRINIEDKINHNNSIRLPSYSRTELYNQNQITAFQTRAKGPKKIANELEDWAAG
jgi:hypothetical protein